MSACIFVQKSPTPVRTNNIVDQLVMILEEIGVIHALGIPAGNTLDLYMSLQTNDIGSS